MTHKKQDEELRERVHELLRPAAERGNEDVGDYLDDACDDLVKLLHSYANERVVEIEKAYGGCHVCYGKGYASYTTAHSGWDTDQDIGSRGGRYYKKVREMRFCKCDRGTQLKAELEKQRKSLSS